MEWNLSPEQDAYQEAFRGWLAGVAPPDVVRRWLDAEGARAAGSPLTLHGAIGYTWEYDLQLFFKRGKPDEKLLGTRPSGTSASPPASPSSDPDSRGRPA